jgi:hypothetical protein
LRRFWQQLQRPKQLPRRRLKEVRQKTRPQEKRKASREQGRRGKSRIESGQAPQRQGVIEIARKKESLERERSAGKHQGAGGGEVQAAKKREGSQRRIESQDHAEEGGIQVKEGEEQKDQGLP